MVEQNARIKHISHLTTFPDAEQAECLLHKLAYMAAYIMQKYGFKLKRLAEFYPPSNHKGLLMGRNTRHEQIEIRLRSESDRTLFLPREVVMDTLIHE
ncbi:hypothetical protein KEM54_006322 [Ascosphaera aggregata]|nr:hypothetical protein KEM54_006322 [Ascosphaera aggregata]